MERSRCDFGKNFISAIQLQLFIEATRTSNLKRRIAIDPSGIEICLYYIYIYIYTYVCVAITRKIHAVRFYKSVSPSGISE